MSAQRGEANRRISPADVVDVFVYVIVLNIAAEYWPAVIAESFTASLVTAVVLKVVLEVVVLLKGWLKDRFRTATTRAGSLLALLLLWAVLVGSKVVVLKLEALLFGDYVSLGGFVSVTALIVVMLLARSGIRRLLTTRQPPAAGEPTSPIDRSVV